MNDIGVQQRAEDRLRLLWRERSTLAPAQWTELYQMVHRLLRGKCPDLVAALTGTAEEFTQDFFQDKVLLPARSGDEIYHSGVVVTYYRRYLLDRLDRAPKPPVDTAGSDADSDASDSTAKVTDQQALDAFLADFGGDELKQLLDLMSASMRGAAPDPRLADAVRVHLGIDLDAYTQAAWQFLDGAGDWVELDDELWWVRLYLARHFCPDNEDRVSLSDLRRRYKIASHHHKAVKLGVSVSKQQDAAMIKFSDSYRGRWLTSLGIPLDEAHRTEIAVALKILCLIALEQQEQGTRGP